VTQHHAAGELEYAQENGITAVPGQDRPGLGLDLLHFNSNSGAQAINLAYLYGAKTIILLGYDMQHTNGQKHFFGDHTGPLHNGNHANYVKCFDKLANDLASEGVEVINCTRVTALTQFKRMDLDAL